MTQAATEPVPRVELAPGYSIVRVVNGCWQLASDHGGVPPDRRAVVGDLLRLAEAGFTTFDGADIYTGVERLLGELVAAWRAAGHDPEALQIHTKYVPDLAGLGGLARRDVERAVDRSLRRLGVERLDLVQFHWWDFGVPGWVEAAGWLAELAAAGKIRCLGVTNFDVPHLARLLDEGLPVVSNQVQYSLLDRRPERGMAALCAERGVRLLAYGTLAGGLLGERYLGRPSPAEPLANRSLTKYRLIVEEAGGWPALQELLGAARRVAERRDATVAQVAQRFVLDCPAVAGVVVGARDAGRLAERRRLLALELDDADRRELARAGAGLPGPAGDVYHLERDRRGPHWAILRTGLHAGGEEDGG